MAIKSISLWARNNKWKARLCFFFIYILLNIVCLFFSEVLFEEGIKIPVSVSYLCCIPLLIAFITYPSKKDKAKYANYYQFQKTLDGVLFISSFVLIICTFNRYQNNNLSFPLSSLSAAEPIKPLPKIKVQSRSAAFVVRHFAQIKTNLLEVRKGYKESSKGSKTALIILSSVMAAFLFVVVLGLSCNVSCSGSQGGGIAVLLLGTALITFLLIKVIHAINRGPKKKEKKVVVDPVDS